MGKGQSPIKYRRAKVRGCNWVWINGSNFSKFWGTHKLYTSITHYEKMPTCCDSVRRILVNINIMLSENRNRNKIDERFLSNQFHNITEVFECYNRPRVSAVVIYGNTLSLSKHNRNRAPRNVYNSNSYTSKMFNFPYRRCARSKTS